MIFFATDCAWYTPGNTIYRGNIHTVHSATGLSKNNVVRAFCSALLTNYLHCNGAMYTNTWRHIFGR